MSLVGRLFVIFFCLFLAIVAAGLALALGVMLPDVVTVSTDPVEHFTFFAASFFATSFVGYVAFVPALVLIAIAETFNIRSIFYYAIAGAGDRPLCLLRLQHFGRGGKHHRYAAGVVQPAACRRRRHHRRLRLLAVCRTQRRALEDPLRRSDVAGMIFPKTGPTFDHALIAARE